MADKKEKLIIVGSGPAGLTAAIYASRGNLNPVVISGRQPGGQLMLTTDVDDFPGFPEGVQGPDLMVKMRAQAEKFGTRFIDEDCISVDLKQKPFIVKTETQELESEAIIVATGASAMWLGLPSEEKLIGRGISSCATCDGPFFKEKDVIVVGGGDTAMREVQHLSKFCKSVTVVHRRGEFRAQAALVDLVKSKTNVKFLMNSAIEEFIGDQKLEKVKIKNTETGEVSEMPIDGVFVAIGHKPNVEFLNGQVELDGGYIKVSNETHSNIEGVFIAGDVADHHYRQAVTAAGSGCKAAMDVEEYLEHAKFGV